MGNAAGCASHADTCDAQVKQMLLKTGAFQDNSVTHVLSVRPLHARASGRACAPAHAPHAGPGRRLRGRLRRLAGGRGEVAGDGRQDCARPRASAGAAHVTHAPPQKQYNGMADCFKKTYAAEGALAFYKGFMPNFARLGSWNVVMFMSLEQVKRLYVQVTAPRVAGQH